MQIITACFCATCTQQKEEVLDGKTLVEKTSVNPTFSLLVFHVLCEFILHSDVCGLCVFFCCCCCCCCFFFLRGYWPQDKIPIGDTMKCHIRLTVLNLCQRLLVL